MADKASKLKYRRIKFRHQLAISFLCGILVLAVATSYSVSQVTENLVVDQQIEQGVEITESFAEQSKLALLYQSEELARDVSRGVIDFPGVVGLRVVTPEGNVLHQHGTLSGSTFTIDSAWPSKAQLISSEHERWTFLAKVELDEVDDDWSAIFGEDTTEQNEPTILGYVAIDLAQDTVVQIRQRTLRTNLYVSLVIAGLVLLSLMALTRRLTNPLEKLSQDMTQAESGDKQVRAEIKGPIDIVNMQHAFNAMMQELEKREAELEKARDSALELARLKGEFAANVTHELRTPMNAVLGMMDLLLAMGLNSKQEEYVETAKSSGENLLLLIDEILDFSEVDANQAEVALSDCFLNEMLDDVIRLLSSSALKKKLDLGFWVDSDVPKMAMVDTLKVRQILINLIGNAIKFTSTGQVAVRLMLKEYTEGDEQLLFRVTDTGPGISTDDRQRVFEAFRQADSSITREHGGTGLGLAISKQLVELLGGEIGVNSEVGQGSEFWFTIPFAPTTSVAPSTKEDKELAESFRHLRALVVDDSAIVRDFARQQLERLQLDVVCVETGLEALEQMRAVDAGQSSFQVVFIDLDIQGLSSQDLVRLLKDENRLNDVLVVYMINPWSDSVAVEEGVTYIAKPLILNTLYECLHLHFFQAGDDDTEEPTVKPTVVSVPDMGSRKVLVVDDNRPNQIVAKGMLERLGCQVDVANDGQEAVSCVVRGDYDLVLMDCQMPVMDGYTATRQIRMYEGGEGRLPIIAMTANAGKAEAQRCFDVGMSEFLAKPLRLNELRGMLSQYLGDVSLVDDSAESSEQQSEGQKPSSCLDPEVLQSLQDDVGEVFASMVQAFLEDTPVYLKSLKSAVIEEDCKGIRELAHTIKGSATNFGAFNVSGLSRDIEERSARGVIEGVPELLEQLLVAYEALSRELESKLVLSEDLEQSKQRFDLMIVDDDRAMRLALQKAFDTKIYRVSEAGNGLQAVSMCSRKMPDLILMDAMMPEMNGFEACQKIRNLPDGADVPILIITALDNEEAIVDAFKAGATDYVPKPIHFAVMKQRVARLIKANKAEKHVKKLAYHDPLTGLPNRAQLMQQLRLMINRASLEKQRLGVLFMDLDHFKLINDTLGHDAGDLLLKAVAERITHCVRDHDFVARLGGDEFTVVLEGVENQADISRVAEKICSSLCQPFVFLQQKMFVTTSVGISLYPDDAEDSSTLLKHADSAMFSAKKNRNGYAYYKEGMEDELARRLELERELHQAISAGELVLHIQPQQCFADGSVRSAEALVRWQHPKHGLLGPNQFIPIAEETDLINQVGRWVLEETCRLLSEWSSNGYEIRLAANISGRELLGVGLEQRLAKLIAQYGLDPSMLELEITESMLMENPQQSERELQVLKKMGLTLAIDDFGSGFSSLNYLKRLPVDVLKIDRTFILDIETDPNDTAIVAGIVALAKSLDLQVLAEGVETQEQYQKLAELNCDSFQGYLLSKPLPVDEFEKLFLAK